MDNPYKQFKHFAFASDSQKKINFSFIWTYFWPGTFLDSVDFVVTKEFMNCSWRESLEALWEENIQMKKEKGLKTVKRV